MSNLDELEANFLKRFFLHNKSTEAKTIISVFSQGATETHYEVWARYKSMLTRCMNNSFNDLTQIHIFRNELQLQPKLFLDATVRDSLMSKSTKDAIVIIERITLSDH